MFKIIDMQGRLCVMIRKNVVIRKAELGWRLFRASVNQGQIVPDKDLSALFGIDILEK